MLGKADQLVNVRTEQLQANGRKRIATAQDVRKGNAGAGEGELLSHVPHLLAHLSDRAALVLGLQIHKNVGHRDALQKGSRSGDNSCYPIDTFKTLGQLQDHLFCAFQRSPLRHLNKHSQFILIFLRHPIFADALVEEVGGTQGQ